MYRKEFGRIIITGPDGTGKSTFIKNELSGCKFFHFDGDTNEIYWKRPDELKDYNVFDRHPLIDYPVLNSTQNIGNKDDIVDYLNCFIYDHKNDFRCFDSVYYFKKIWVEPSVERGDPQWVIDNIHNIRSTYQLFIDMLRFYELIKIKVFE